VAYGATAEDVGAYLPHHTLSASSTVTLNDVERFIDHVGALISSRIGDALARLDALTDDEAGERAQSFRENAAVLEALGGASLTEGTLNPEGSTLEVSDGTLAGVLWERYRQGLEDLATAVSDYMGARGLDVSTGTGGAVPAVSAPCPYFLHDMRF
jgi:hypothetical protein